MNERISEELDADIKSLTEKLSTMTNNDINDALRNLFVKHLHLEDYDFILDKSDLLSLVSSSKTEFAKLPAKIAIKGRTVSAEEKRVLAIALATIGTLRRLGVLHRIAKFPFDNKV